LESVDARRGEKTAHSLWLKCLLNTVVTLALNTALRKNEIRTLRWSQIDFEKRTVTVGRAKTQEGTGRVIPINQPAFEALVKWAGRLVESNSEDYVFPSCEAAGIERKHLTASALTLPGLLSLGGLPGVQPSSERA
jgi:integrase